MAENRIAQIAPAAAATDEPAVRALTLTAAPPEDPGDPFAFDPVALRPRRDGWTPARQREYVEALADCGVARQAAARVGMSEQSVNRLRRRAEAHAFDLACEAALRHGARRLRAIAFERAIEGTIRRHYYHGELRSEERVYDNRLLVYLLGRTAHLLDEPEAARAVAAHWEPWVEAIEQGAPPPALSDLEAPGPASEPEPEPDEDETAFDGSEVWQRDGVWWTSFPPRPEDDEPEVTDPGTGYRRRLTEAEEELIEADEERLAAEAHARQQRRRDLYFAAIARDLVAAGIDDAGAEFFLPREAELYETSAETARE